MLRLLAPLLSTMLLATVGALALHAADDTAHRRSTSCLADAVSCF